MQDENTQIYREVLENVLNNEQFITSLSAIGDGLLLASKR
jgi:predicted O-methyltransferase YrrM